MLNLVIDTETKEILYKSRNEQDAYNKALEIAIERANELNEDPDYDPSEEPDYELFEGTNIQIQKHNFD